MLKLVRFFRDVMVLKMVRVTNTAVNILIKMPQNSTVANPLIGQYQTDIIPRRRSLL